LGLGGCGKGPEPDAGRGGGSVEKREAEPDSARKTGLGAGVGVVSGPPAELSVEAVRAWHAAGGLAGSRWAREQRLDLNGDGEEELFLGVSAQTRWMLYAVFTRRAEGWVLLSDGVEASDLGLEVQPEARGGWREFVSWVATGRGGLHRITYAWDGRRYFRKVTAGVASKESPLEPIPVRK
ncbi:MAG: hypothetical protein RLZZ142_2877, partial [Verrucomicrobiota bacterium]